MISPETEYIEFSDSVYAQGAVEHWLTKIEFMMTQSLYDLTKNAWKIYPTDGTKRDDWLFHTGAQPILTIDMVMWTFTSDKAINDVMKGKNRQALTEHLDFCER